MSRIRYAVAGNGWRAMFFVRAAKNLPELFELTGVLCRTKEKAEAFEREHGVKAYHTLDALLETKPQFVVTCVTKAALADMTMQILERGVPVLSETPLAVDIPTLERLWETHVRTGTPLEMAEQYFLYPSHQAKRKIVKSGLLGDVRNVWMSMMHDYHGISMLRAYLGEENGPVEIRARKIYSPIAVTGSRAGYTPGSETGDEYRTLAQFTYADGRIGLYDFSGTQYHSAIRSNHMRILGTRGEIFDDEVRYLRGDDRPETAKLVTRCDMITGTIRTIEFDGTCVYRNPFRWDVAMTEDDIAVSTVLVRMGDRLAGGGAHYPHAFRDSYMSCLLLAAAQEDGKATTQKMPWD